MERMLFYLRASSPARRPSTTAATPRSGRSWSGGDSRVGHPQLQRLPARHGRLVLRGVRAGRGDRIRGPRSKSRQPALESDFRDVIAEDRDANGQPLFYDEVFHTDGGGEGAHDPRLYRLSSSTPSVSTSTRRSMRIPGRTSSRPSPRPASATTPASGVAPCRVLRRVLPGHRDRLRAHGRARGHPPLGQGVRGDHHDHHHR